VLIRTIAKIAGWPVVIGLLIAIAMTDANAMARLVAPRLTQSGDVAEIRFGLHGRAGQMTTSAHANQLWIDLARARLGSPPNALAALRSPLINGISAVDLGNRRVRLIVEFSTRADYAVARLPGELVVRSAPAGSDPQLASSLRAELQRPFSQPPRTAAADVAVAFRDLSGSRRSIPVSSEDETKTSNIALLVPPGSPAPASLHLTPGARAPLVIVDPGHGGFDSGTEAGAPIMEKTVALEIALKLAKALEARGMRAELTRDRDFFVPLSGRTALANQAGADLFVSIHLNSSPNSATNGIETYYLNNTTDRATIRLARMENGSGSGYGAGHPGDLNYILADMQQNYKANDSATVARLFWLARGCPPCSWSAAFSPTTRKRVA
jgi:N-acetylmuramoyl-L-alanine amidase